MFGLPRLVEGRSGPGRVEVDRILGKGQSDDERAADRDQRRQGGKLERPARGDGMRELPQPARVLVTMDDAANALEVDVDAAAAPGEERLPPPRLEFDEAAGPAR